MDNFDLRKFLSEGKLHEVMSAQDTEDIAGMVADEFTKESADEGEYLRYSVGRVEGTGFELDTEATDMSSEDLDMRGVGEGWGGNFSVKASEDGYEVRNAEKGGLVATIDGMGNFTMLSADESRAEMGLEEGEMLDEGILDGIKDKIVAKVEKIKDKFSAEEIEKMKSAAERALGKSAEEFTMADFTVGNIKKVGKAINALNEEQIEEGLGDTIQKVAVGLGLPAMFVGGHIAMGSGAGGIEAFAAGAIAFVIGMIGGAIINNRNNEAQEAPKSTKMKKSELKEMIKAAMLAEAEEDEVADDIEVEDEVEVDTDVDVDMDMDAETPEVDGIDVKQDADAELSGNVGDVQDNLEAALEAARKLGDEKLEDQIGNTLTFFTRSHVVKEGDKMDLEESAASNLELKNIAKQLYLGFKKMGADVELTKGKVVLNKKPADGNMDSKDVFIFVDDDRVVVELVGDKAIGFYDPIQKDFSQFEFSDGGDGETWNNAKIKRLIIHPGKTTSESLNESVTFPMWNKIK